MVPLAACPSSPDNVKPISELAGIKVGQVIIGSCTNSSYRDLAMVAQVLKGRRVSPNLTLAIAPGSRQVLEMLSRNGMLADIIGAKKSYKMTSWAFVGVGVSYQGGSTGYITVDDVVELYPNDPNVLAYANEIYETAALFNFQTDDYWTTYVDSDETLSVREDGAYLGYKDASDGNIYGYSGLDFDQETGTVGEAPANVSLIMEEASIWDAGISTDLVDTTGQVVGTIPAPFTVADQTAELHAGIDYSLAETDIDVGDGTLAHVALPTAYGESEDWIRDMIALHPLTGPDMAYNLTYNLVGSNGLTWKDFINSITIEIVDGSIYIDIMMYGMGGIYIPDLASYAVNAELHWITMIDGVGETVVPDVGAIVPPVAGGGETGGAETSEPSAN